MLKTLFKFVRRPSYGNRILQVVSQPKPIARLYCQNLERRVNPSKMDKRFLVWTGKYKSVAEVPDSLPVKTVEHAKNKARVRIANYMMLGTIAGCILMVIMGKKAAERGESVSQMNLDWHKLMDEEAKKK